MTEDDLRHIERTAHALASWGMYVQADMMYSLIAEVRRLQAATIIPSGVDEAAELAKLLVRKHGGRQNARRIMRLPEPEPTVVTGSILPEDKAKLIAELQKTPVEELVEFWDMRRGVFGVGCKLKSGRESFGEYLTWHPDGNGPSKPRYVIPLSACVKHVNAQGECVGYRTHNDNGDWVVLPLSEVTVSTEVAEPQHVVEGK